MSGKLLLKLRLIASPIMGEKGELNSIRFPRSTRERLNLTANSIVKVGVGEYQTELKVKKALRADIRRLGRMLSQNRLTEEEALFAGFVAKTVQQRVARHRNGEDLWLSTAAEPITIGADPEFGLIDSNGILRPGSTVLLHDGLFGSDGPGAEVRPKASKDHRQLVENINKILASPPDAAKKYHWIGGATFQDKNRKYWFGGHIHLGRPAGISENAMYACYEGVTTALDHLVALPLVRLDTPDPSSRRNGCKYGYGKAGTFDSGGSDASIRAHGNRFEYRVLSGLWLTHPNLAKVVLGVTKCVAESAYAKARVEEFDPDWVAAPPSRKGLAKSLGIIKTREIIGIINRAKPEEITEEHLKRWKKQLRNLDYYDDYKREIEALIQLTTCVPNSLKLDIKENWLAKAPLVKKGPKKLMNSLEAVEED